jgi:hypothetical protein
MTLQVKLYIAIYRTTIHFTYFRFEPDHLFRDIHVLAFSSMVAAHIKSSPSFFCPGPGPKKPAATMLAI